MNLFLRNIATIRRGYQYRGSVKASSRGNVSIIQMSDAWPERIKQPLTFPRVALYTVPVHHFLRAGDVIFRPSGPNTTAILIEKDLPGIICSNNLMVIRIGSQHQVLPAYLNWYINLPSTQREIAALAVGKKGRAISRQSMEGLELPIPTLAMQQFIVAEDSKAQLALQHAPWKEEAHAQLNAILLGYAGDERHQDPSKVS